MSVPFKFRQHFRDLYESFHNGQPLTADDLSSVAALLAPSLTELNATYIAKCPLNAAGFLEYVFNAQAALNENYEAMAWKYIKGALNDGLFSGVTSMDIKELRSTLDPLMRPVRMDVQKLYEPYKEAGVVTVDQLCEIFKEMFPAGQVVYLEVYRWARATKVEKRGKGLGKVAGVFGASVQDEPKAATAKTRAPGAESKTETAATSVRGGNPPVTAPLQPEASQAPAAATSAPNPPPAAAPASQAEPPAPPAATVAEPLAVPAEPAPVVEQPKTGGSDQEVTPAEDMAVATQAQPSVAEATSQVKTRPATPLPEVAGVTAAPEGENVTRAPVPTVASSHSHSLDASQPTPRGSGKTASLHGPPGAAAGTPIPVSARGPLENAPVTSASFGSRSALDFSPPQIRDIEPPIPKTHIQSEGSLGANPRLTLQEEKAASSYEEAVLEAVLRTIPSRPSSRSEIPDVVIQYLLELKAQQQELQFVMQQELHNLTANVLATEVIKKRLDAVRAQRTATCFERLERSRASIIDRMENFLLRSNALVKQQPSASELALRQQIARAQRMGFGDRGSTTTAEANPPARLMAALQQGDLSMQGATQPLEGRGGDGHGVSLSRKNQKQQGRADAREQLLAQELCKLESMQANEQKRRQDGYMTHGQQKSGLAGEPHHNSAARRSEALLAGLNFLGQQMAGQGTGLSPESEARVLRIRGAQRDFAAQALHRSPAGGRVRPSQHNAVAVAVPPVPWESMPPVVHRDPAMNDGSDHRAPGREALRETSFSPDALEVRGLSAGTRQPTAGAQPIGTSKQRTEAALSNQQRGKPYLTRDVTERMISSADAHNTVDQRLSGYYSAKR